MAEVSQKIIDICSSGCKIIFYKPPREDWFSSWMRISSQDSITIVKLMHCLPSYMFEDNTEVCGQIAVCGIGANFRVDVKNYCDNRLLTTPYLVTKISSKQFLGSYRFEKLTFDKIVHYTYTQEIEQPSDQQLDSYKNKLWNHMYNSSFSDICILLLILCYNFLIPDIKKPIINSILIIEKWNILGFRCE